MYFTTLLSIVSVFDSSYGCLEFCFMLVISCANQGLFDKKSVKT